jgi:hypothetical protein
MVVTFGIHASDFQVSAGGEQRTVNDARDFPRIMEPFNLRFNVKHRQHSPRGDPKACSLGISPTSMDLRASHTSQIR